MSQPAKLIDGWSEAAGEFGWHKYLCDARICATEEYYDKELYVKKKCGNKIVLVTRIKYKAKMFTTQKARKIKNFATQKDISDVKMEWLKNEATRKAS